MAKATPQEIRNIVNNDNIYELTLALFELRVFNFINWNEKDVKKVQILDDTYLPWQKVYLNLEITYEWWGKDHKKETCKVRKQLIAKASQMYGWTFAYPKRPKPAEEPQNSPAPAPQPPADPPAKQWLSRHLAEILSLQKKAKKDHLEAFAIPDDMLADLEPKEHEAARELLSDVCDFQMVTLDKGKIVCILADEITI